MTARIGFIGGSGLYEMDGLEGPQAVDVDTPFGPPSDSIVVGELSGERVAFLPRHGRGHRISPSNLPARANIYALKLLGVERVVSVSAVGSLQERIRPLDMVVPDQLIDRTRGRPNTFFDEGIVVHTAFAEPYCPILGKAVWEAASREATAHRGGACVVIEGPQFSTRAESELFRSWGAAIIGMTALPEARLAREAEMCYATLALVTDYDTWHETEEQVSVELVVQNLLKNVEASRRVIRSLVTETPSERDCGCASALENAIITSPELIGNETRARLSALIGRYLEPHGGGDAQT